MDRQNDVQYLDSQAQRGYASCQLVSALNALIFYGHPVDMSDEKFEEIIDLCSGKYGAIQNIRPAYRYLKLWAMDIKPSIDTFRKWIDRRYPVEVCAYREWTGLHAVTLVGRGKGYFVIANWDMRSPPVEVLEENLDILMDKYGQQNRRAKVLVMRSG